MSDTATETPLASAESASEAVTTEDSNPDTRREARYRKERNEARDALVAANTRIESFQRSEIERLVSDKLSHPGDLFTLSGNSVADYLNDSGDVDPGKVAADVAAVLAERPGLRKTSPAFDPTQGVGGGTPKPKPTWGSVLRSESSTTYLGNGWD